MAIVKSINVSITAVTTGFEKGLQTARKNLNSFVSNTLGTIGQLAGVSASLYGTATAIRSMIGSSEEFAKSMAHSTAIMTDMSTETRSQMEMTAKQVAFNTTFSAAQAADAYFFLASAGLDAQQSIAAMPVVAKFAQAGMFDLSTATDMLMQAQNAMGLRTADATENMKQMSRIANVLAQANIMSTATVQQLGAALTNDAAGAMRIVGMSLEEGVAILAAFANRGVQAEEAGTQLAIVLRELQTRAIDNAGAFDAAGVSVFDAFGNFNNFADILGSMEAKMAGLSDEAKKSFLLELGFTDKSMKSIQTLMGSSEEIRNAQSQFEGVGDVIGDIASKNVPEFTKAMNQLKATWEAFSIDFGGRIAASLAESRGGISTFAGILATLVDVIHTINLGWMLMKVGVIAIMNPIDTIAMSLATVGIMLADIVDYARMIGKFLPGTAASMLGQIPEGAGDNIRSFFGGILDGTSETEAAMREASKAFTEAAMAETPGQAFLDTIKQMQKPLESMSAAQGKAASETFAESFAGSDLWDWGTQIGAAAKSEAAAAFDAIGEQQWAMTDFGQTFGQAAAGAINSAVNPPAAITGGPLSNEAFSAFQDAKRAQDYDKQQTELLKKVEAGITKMSTGTVVLAVAGGI